MATKMIRKPNKKKPDEFELSVAQELHNLQMSSTEIKADLENLFIVGAKQVDVSGGKKAIIIRVPFRLLRHFHKIQNRLVPELEKKFIGRHVVIIANRIVSTKLNRDKTKPKPRTRTVTAIHDSILEDLVFPTEIVGKRTRFRIDGSKLMKIQLDPKDQVNVETKLDTFSFVYKELTKRDVEFEFPVQE
mmetsp:Transcript_4133/g.5724  ORF Transcript_4133/g.5724 Transcript_4133/m.5724 type:complete len:189 (+) Transcript_4133:73-639(+)|eukprot:CAMPEP_0171463440 /NCGR_PEP_ID=MMETSP0945-20130129/7112_1 /TAXON_ID=109269 /ORGANISM="Vaucheria litorea, Strain CCMP2940" /LENGTH=188 /DNA_ID=CAMNT_0011990237 /DNA_START=67 /DNA_END=633 /DNA_ORIENTATION=+